MIYGSRSESVFLVSGFCQKLYSLCWSQWIEIKTFLFIPVLKSLYFGSLFDKLWDKIILNQSKSWHHVKSETNMFILNMKKMKNDSMLHIADSHFSDFRNLFIFTFFPLIIVGDGDTGFRCQARYLAHVTYNIDTDDVLYFIHLTKTNEI